MITPDSLADLIAIEITPSKAQALVNLAPSGKTKVRRGDEKAIIACETVVIVKDVTGCLCRTTWGAGTHDIRQPPLLATLTVLGILVRERLLAKGIQPARLTLLDER
ncbi:hypothetical protein FHT02_004429 [Sphingomonas xinjiangensis]|uniref:Uncharacterized protein n=1 Tax=Sphingomonas xinjiangensis TaxID=643568 RepID=A0A840YTV8_9SPHN|nr:hypothetical protein [Sphingomonas xinjiangensis]